MIDTCIKLSNCVNKMENLNSTIAFNVELIEPVLVTLKDILNGDVDELEQLSIPTAAIIIPTNSVERMCVECDDQVAEAYCKVCDDDFCNVCLSFQHRKGKRKLHETVSLKATVLPEIAVAKTTSKSSLKAAIMRTFIGKAEVDTEEDLATSGTAIENVVERSKYIPVRLDFEERRYLRLLDAALNVSEYTDKIDVIGSYTSKSKRIVGQIKELCSILSGLVLAADYNAGQKLFKDSDFEDNAEFFQDIFELGRRSKIMNPSQMRSTYGKLVFLLQDSQFPEIQEMLAFKCVKPIVTVYSTLTRFDALAVLEDPLIGAATMEIMPLGRSRYEIQKEIKKKERSIEYLSKRYAKNGLSGDLIRLCLYSIGDNNSFLRTNRDPCDQMIKYLTVYFDPTTPEDNHSLAIQQGREGARLSHGHSRQYAFVLQSLQLWREILHDMFKLWTLAEQDLLDGENPYRLRDTGQGLNRVQPSPRVSKAIHSILHKAMQKVGSWVGSTVIHLNDKNTPNALVFIDKYSQVFRILQPLVSAIENLDKIDSPALCRYINDEFGSKELAKKRILLDFFRHAFDGSGADNSFDAGSCIDGRLTSAWNFCSLIEKKDYYALFLLDPGFNGFDGSF